MRVLISARLSERQQGGEAESPTARGPFSQHPRQESNLRHPVPETDPSALGLGILGSLPGVSVVDSCHGLWRFVCESRTQRVLLTYLTTGGILDGWMTPSDKLAEMLQ